MLLFVVRNNQLSANNAVILCHALTVNTTLKELGQYHICLAQGPELEPTDSRFNRVHVLKHVIKWAWQEHKKATGNTPSFAI